MDKNWDLSGKSDICSQFSKRGFRFSLREDANFYNNIIAFLFGMGMTISYILLSSLGLGLTLFYLLLVGTVLTIVIKKDPSIILSFLIIWIPIQSFVLTLIWQYIGLTILNIRGLIALKEIVVLMLLIYLLVTRKIKYLMAIDKIALGYFGICSLYFVLPEFILPTRLGFIPSLASYRTLVAPILLYSIARFTPISNIKFRKLLNLLLIMAILIAVFGLIEYFILPMSVWHKEINMTGFVNQVQGVKQEYFAKAGIPDRFGDRRLKSFFTHPNGISYYFAFIITLLVALLMEKNIFIWGKHTKKLLFSLILLCSSAQILSLGRGGILSTLVALSVLSLYRKRFWLVLFFLGILILLNFSVPVIERLVTGTSQRASLLWSVRVIPVVEKFLENPLGYGIGQGQIWGLVFSSGQRYFGIGESGYFNIAIQIGIFGFLFFVSFLGSIVTYLVRSVKLITLGYRKALVLAIGVCTLGLAISEVVANLFGGFEIFGTFWIFAGIAVRLVASSKKCSLIKGSFTGGS